MSEMNTTSTNESCLLGSLPPIKQLPTDGFGGSYYDYQFPIPVYSRRSENIFHTMSWSNVDTYYNLTASNAIECAVSLGVCTVTLLNLVVLTPQPKRKLPLHGFICLALCSQIIRNATDVVLMTASLPASSYCFLTQDIEVVKLSLSYYSLVSVAQVSACMSFISVQACFFIQGCGLMTWLRIHYRLVYYGVLIYLVSAGVVATGMRIGVAAFQIKNPLNSNSSPAYVLFNRGTLVTYGISIGSWSLVFFVSTMSIIVNRHRTLFYGNGFYDTALNLIAIFGLQSFVIPSLLSLRYPVFTLTQMTVLLCIMELVPFRWTFNQPEQLILPSVLFLLPIGSLFLTVNTVGNRSGDIVSNQSAITGDDSARLLSRCPAAAEDGVQLRSVPARASTSTSLARAKQVRKIVGVYEAELAAIDALDERQN